MAKCLSIIDPALGISRGHHLAAFESIAATFPGNFEAFGSACSESLMAIGGESHYNEAFIPVFSQPFYQLSESSSSVEISSYIHQLACDFVRVLKNAESEVAWIHTLSWEHACALSLAIEHVLTCEQLRIKRVLVFLMFNPGIDHNGYVADPRLFGRFKSGFERLARFSCVNFYAPCLEYAWKYQKLIESKSTIEVHPVFFDSPYSDCSKRPENDAEILYLGDVKSEKGFRDLPLLIEARIPECNRLFVHFSSNEESALLAVEQRIVDLCEAEPRLELHTGFLAAAELDQLFARAARIHLDYDPCAYAEQTSGVLWLAVRRGLEVITQENTWLARELAILSENPTISGAEGKKYRDVIFKDFGHWLESKIEVWKS